MTSGGLAVAPSLEDARGFSTGYNVVLPVAHSFLDGIEIPVPVFLKVRRAAGCFSQTFMARYLSTLSRAVPGRSIALRRPTLHRRCGRLLWIRLCASRRASASMRTMSLPSGPVFRPVPSTERLRCSSLVWCGACLVPRGLRRQARPREGG
jgi:hypothetical protein